jgi:hypothetical protein
MPLSPLRKSYFRSFPSLWAVTARLSGYRRYARLGSGSLRVGLTSVKSWTRICRYYTSCPIRSAGRQNLELACRGRSTRWPRPTELSLPRQEVLDPEGEHVLGTDASSVRRDRVGRDAAATRWRGHAAASRRTKIETAVGALLEKSGSTADALCFASGAERAASSVPRCAFRHSTGRSLCRGQTVELTPRRLVEDVPLSPNVCAWNEKITCRAGVPTA